MIKSLLCMVIVGLSCFFKVKSTFKIYSECSDSVLYVDPSSLRVKFALGPWLMSEFDLFNQKKYWNLFFFGVDMFPIVPSNLRQYEDVCPCLITLNPVLPRVNVDFQVFKVIWDSQECRDMKGLQDRWAPRSVCTRRHIKINNLKSFWFDLNIVISFS